MKQAILALCTGRYLSLQDLSRLLGRKQGNLRDNYVSEMLRDGLLELRHPEALNHPGQAYRTRAASDDGQA